MWHDVPPADWLAGFEGKKGKRSAKTGLSMGEISGRFLLANTPKNLPLILLWRAGVAESRVFLRLHSSISARLEARNSTAVLYRGDERYPKNLTCIMHAGTAGLKNVRLRYRYVRVCELWLLKGKFSEADTDSMEGALLDTLG